MLNKNFHNHSTNSCIKSCSNFIKHISNLTNHLLHAILIIIKDRKLKIDRHSKVIDLVNGIVDEVSI